MLQSGGGTRVVPAREFTEGPYQTVLDDAEMLVEVRIPVRPGSGSAYEKVERRAGDWAIAAAGAYVVLDGDTVVDAGIGLAALGAAHSCAPEAESYLIGRTLGDDTIAEAARLAVDVVPAQSPISAARSPTSATSPTSSPGAPAPRRRPRPRRDRPVNVTITVNGVERTDDVEPRLLLVHYLRDTLQLRGTHWGCDTSQCGTCTVWLDDTPVKSCTVLAPMADGRTVRTVEGLADGAELDPVQAAFMSEHGLQCGFCTPGMMMTARHLLDHNPDPDERTIREAISGQICRCTGYENIVRAVRAAAGHPSQPSGHAAADPRSDGDSTVVGEPSQEVPA